MTDPEVERAARFLAAHGVLLLGLGTLAALAALVAVAGALRLVRRYRQRIRRAFTYLVARARGIQAVDRLLTRSSAVMPSGYLALHLTLGLILTITATVFLVIAEEALGGGEIAAFDTAFASALHATGTPGWRRFFTVVSWLGEQGPITVATLIVAAGLLFERNAVLAAGWVAAQAGGGLLNLALKETFARTRPETADPLLAASSWSFPSGHAMGTFILFGLGCYLLLRNVRSWVAAGVAITVSLSWCVVMGFSRLYLGVHFASDVLAGVIAGAAWVAACASAFEMIRRGGKARAPRRAPPSAIRPNHIRGTTTRRPPTPRPGHLG